MRFIRTITVLLFALVFVMGAAANGSKEQESSGEQQAAEEPELTFLRSGGTTEEEVVKPIAQQCAADVGASLNMVMVPWGQTFDKIMTMVAGNNAPDVAYIGSRWIPQFADIGAIAPMNVPEERKNEYYDSIWPMVTWKGEIYGIPRAFSTKVLFYNTDLFEQAGIDGPPETWSELASAAQAINENTDAYGFTLAGEKFVSTTSQFFNFLFQNGGSVFDDEGNVVLNNQRGVEALEFYAQLAEHSEDGPTAYRREELWELFAEGKAGMYVSGPWRVGAFEGKVNFSTAPLPAGPQGDSASILVSDSLVTFAQSEIKQKANDFALCLSSYDNQKKLDTQWGMTPMRKQETEIDFFQQEKWSTFIKMVPRGEPQPLVSDWEKLESTVTDMIQFVLLDKMEPKEALDWAAERLKGLKG
jgi:multiple sugar transport system substrate-binding protein